MRRYEIIKINVKRNVEDEDEKGKKLKFCLIQLKRVPFPKNNFLFMRQEKNMLNKTKKII